MRKQIFAALAVGCVAVAAKAAVPTSTTVFDDDLPTYTYPWGQEVSMVYAYGSAALDTSNSYTGSASMKFSPSGTWAQGGVGVNGNFFHFADDGTTVSCAIYVADNGTGDSQAIKAMTVQAQGFTDFVFGDGNSNLWTVDGQAGKTEFSRNQWHVLTFDMAAASNGQVAQGTSGLGAVLAWADDTAPVYLDNVTMSAVPEPAALGLLGVVGLLGLKRKRKAV